MRAASVKDFAAILTDFERVRQKNSDSPEQNDKKRAGAHLPSIDLALPALTRTCMLSHRRANR